MGVGLQGISGGRLVKLLHMLGGSRGRGAESVWQREGKESHLWRIYVLGIKAFMLIIP